MTDLKELRICGLMKTTLLDFPGRVACTVFLPGCNMRCPFCHNPRVVFGKDEIIPTEDVLSFLKKRQGVLDGVCITGGEPTLYGGALKAFIKEIKSLGFLVKLDTNGTSPSLLRELFSEGLLDYVAMDIKSALTKEAYETACGCAVDLDSIKESIALISESGADYEFRTTVVSEIHTEDDILSAARCLAGKKRYFLQSFVDSGDLIEKEIVFSEMDKEKMLDIAKKASVFVPTFVRGI